MKIFRTTNDLRTALQSIRYQQKVSLVPTMGNLHNGHLDLVRQAKSLSDIVVTSIFVNPLQFGPAEDFDQYPRTLESDIEKLTALGVDFVFAPTTQDMYGALENQTGVRVPKISDRYCGEFRPGFFYGVTTIVAKLFNIVQPDIAVFGEKDFQQLHIIKKMVADLAFPIEIISAPTVRENDGLAMSSRNQYLNSDERRVATQVFRVLSGIREEIMAGNKDYTHLIESAIEELTHSHFRVDYLHICQKETLEMAKVEDTKLVIIIACWMGRTRLIDNIQVLSPSLAC